MTLEATIKNILAPLVDGRLYTDITPDVHVLPLILYTQTGGKAYSYVEQKLPEKRNARIQIDVLADTRLEANALARRIEQAIIENIPVSTPLGAFTATFQKDLKLYGTRQDFSIWY